MDLLSEKDLSVLAWADKLSEDKLSEKMENATTLLSPTHFLKICTLKKKKAAGILAKSIPIGYV